MISVVINADTRQGYLNAHSQVGDYGSGSLQGVRSAELLTSGLKNKLKFFDGYDIQCIMYIDQHEPLSDRLFMDIDDIVKSCGNNSKLICKEHNRTKYRWNDYLYIESLKLGEGDYIVHFDNDTDCYKREGSDIVERYFNYLDVGFSYICQPWDGTGDYMWWASTRFFICKKETLALHLPTVENNLTTPFMGKHTPCVEHLLGVLAGEGGVLYPNREDDEYMIFCWSKYYNGIIERLNKMPYEKVKEYILACGLFGCNDVFAKPINNE